MSDSSYCSSGLLTQPAPTLPELPAAKRLRQPPATPGARNARLAYSVARAATPFVGMVHSLPIGREYLGRGR